MKKVLKKKSTDSDSSKENVVVAKDSKQKNKKTPKKPNRVLSDDESSNESVSTEENDNDKINSISVMTKEWSPSLSDTKWEKVTSNIDSKCVYYKYEGIPHIENYVKNFISDAEKRVKEIKSKTYQNKNNFDKKDVNIYKILKFYDENVSVVSCTTGLIKDCVIGILSSFLQKRQTSCQLDIFADIGKVKYKLVACYKGKLGSKELIDIKNSYSDFDKKTKDEIGNIFGYYVNMMKKYITDDVNHKIKSKKYYIQRLYKKTDPIMQYIFGSYEKLRTKDISVILNTFCLDFGKGLVEIELLAQMDCKLEIEGLYKVDEYIKKFESIKKGKNICFNIINPNYSTDDVSDIKKDVFLMVQMCIMNELFVEKCSEKTKGYIGCIESGGNKFLFSGNGPIKKKIEYFYMMGHVQFPEYEKICEVLWTEKFEDLKIYIIEKEIDDICLENRLFYYINRMGTYEKGLNVIKKAKSAGKMMFAMLNNKK